MRRLGNATTRRSSFRWARLATPTTMLWRRASSPRLTCELLERRRFKTQAEARLAVFAFIEGF